MSLDGFQFQQIQDALLDAFNVAELQRMLRIQLGATLAHITTGSSLREQTAAVIEWADAAGRVAHLLCGMDHEQPDNGKVRALVAAALRWPDCQQAGLVLLAGRSYANALRSTEQDYLAAIVQKYSKWEETYTPLAGKAEVQTHAAGTAKLGSAEFIPTSFVKLTEYGFGGASRIEQIEVADLRQAVARYKRLVVLGEPGAGKTTTLMRLLYDYAVVAQEDPTAPLPVLAPLSGYSGDETALIYVQSHSTTLAPYLPAYLAHGRAVLLLDALNEMPRQGYGERVGRIQTLLNQFPMPSVVVTCRALDYVEKLQLEKLEIKPLDRDRQREYLHRYLGDQDGERLFWQLAGGAAVGELWQTWQGAGASWEAFWTAEEMPKDVYSRTSVTQDELWRTLSKNGLPPLLALGMNPFLLRMFAQVFVAGDGALPQNRGKLFAAFVATLLERERERREPHAWPGAEVVSHGLAALAYAMQLAGERGTAVEREWAARQLTATGCNAAEVLYLGASASLLDATGHQVRFIHQLIQEYLAAFAWQEKVAAGDDLRQYWPAGEGTPAGWEETAILLAGILPDMTPFVDALRTVNPVVAARCIGESGGAPPNSDTIANLQTTLADVIASLTLPVNVRNAAGNVINYVDDPRPGVGLRADGLPDLLWCAVPAGPFIMGNTKQTDKEARGSEAPQHRPTLAAFAISQYPITNAQFAVFVQAGGYTEQWRRCWTKAGWTWKESINRIGPWRAGGVYDLPNHPVVGVSWYEAMAFCGWLSVKLGQLVALPTEAQWEKAARGTDGRRYPWGPELTPEHANYDKTGIGTTSAVGILPRGASPYGALDMAGNVWEWTTTRWIDNYQGYKPDDSPEGDERRVVRGGAFFNIQRSVRCAARRWSYPISGSRYRGFRVVLSPSSTSGL